MRQLRKNDSVHNIRRNLNMEEWFVRLQMCERVRAPFSKNPIRSTNTKWHRYKEARLTFYQQFLDDG